MDAKEIQKLASMMSNGKFCWDGEYELDGRKIRGNCYGCCCEDGCLDMECPIILKHLQEYLDGKVTIEE